MKIRRILFAAVAAVFMMSFTNTVVEFKVDEERSKLTWTGSKVVGEHSGHIKLLNGSLLTDGDKVTGGNFEIDMNSITNTDLEDQEYNQKLVGHLKSEDFFATEKFPVSKLAINEVVASGGDQYNLKGDLTIKGITKPIEFPATIKTDANKITATAKIIVDRTKYGIKYGSGSFFDDLGDKAINDEFELDVELIAVK